jgi:hypothetical protein
MSTQFAIQRRNHIKHKGRVCVLGKWVGSEGNMTQTKIPIQAFPYTYRPDQILGAIQQGDMLVETTADEIGASGWDIPTTQFYWLEIDGQKMTIINSQAIYDGSICIGYSIWARG